jgi:hypothetical protein
MNRFTACLSLLLGLACLSTAAAEFPSSAPDRTLDAAIRRAAERPPDPNQAVAAAKVRLTARIRELEATLARSGAAARDGWNKWLDLPALKAELARPEPDVATLSATEDRFYRNQPGLELRSFVAVRRELGAYLAALEYAADPSPADAYRQRLTELSGLLLQLQSQPNDDAARSAGTIIGWAEALGPDGAALARAIRNRFASTNAQVQISGQMINVLLAQNVQERQFITDVILGSYTRGPAFSSGQVTFGVIPNSRAGTLEVRLRGQTVCPSNVATKGRVEVHSSSRTSLAANKQVHFFDQGLSLAPATARCQTDATIHDIQAGGRLIERFAWRKATQLLPEAEAAASRHAEREASAKLDQQADSALGGVNDMFRDQIRAPLIRLGALPEQWRFWTDHRHLRMALVQSSGDQLAIATRAPQMPGEYDLGLAVHESMVNNFCESVLGGATVKDETWLDILNILTGTSPRPLWVHDRTERWSVTMAEARPLAARFSGERITLTLHVAGLTRGERREPIDTTIEASYQPQITRDGPTLIRDGELIVRGNETEADHAFLVRKFGAVFPAELHFSGLVPPTGGSLGKLRRLSVAEFKSDAQWMTLAYQLGTSRE